MSMTDLSAAIEAGRRSQGRRYLATPRGRTMALAASVGVRKRTDQVLAYVSPTTHAELVRRAAELDIAVNGFAAYLIERAIRDILPGLPQRSRPNPIVSCACGCGARFEQMDGDSRPRRFVVGHNRRRVAAAEAAAP